MRSGRVRSRAPQMALKALGESGAFRDGRVERRLPCSDGRCRSATLAGTRDCLRSLPGASRRRCGARRGRSVIARLVAPETCRWLSVFKCWRGRGDGSLGVAPVVLAVVEIGLRAGERVVEIVRHAADECWRSAEVGGGGVAELFEAEGERVVGVTAREGDLGPVMGEGVIDLGDAFDPPVVLVIPSGTAGDRFFADVDVGRTRRPRVVAARARRRSRAGEGLRRRG